MKQIDYRQYKDDELLDVERNINKQAFPERYKQLCDEISRRKKLGCFNLKPQLKENEFDRDYWRRSGIIFEFSTIPIVWRMTFVGAYLLVNVALLAWVMPHYWVSSLDNLHRYNITVDQIECRRDAVENQQTGEINDFYDIVISAYPNTFVAPNLHRSKCKQIAATLTSGMLVSIWQQDELIYQLQMNQQMLLSYDYMAPKVRNFRTRGQLVYFFILFGLGILSFKSLYNAFIPGTFKQQYRGYVD